MYGLMLNYGAADTKALSGAHPVLSTPSLRKFEDIKVFGRYEQAAGVVSRPVTMGRFYSNDFRTLL